ncbi:uncharacterized protein LOC143238137 isoform X2 [Tachypleus tridentatus]|uniref:uncharacterized protein LOC143238137 isoform X2 n=1 Tax=Tachypleus tridentatus TaxID=6853 RepID=UPI003FD02ED6
MELQHQMSNIKQPSVDATCAVQDVRSLSVSNCNVSKNNKTTSSLPSTFPRGDSSNYRWLQKTYSGSVLKESSDKCPKLHLEHSERNYTSDKVLTDSLFTDQPNTIFNNELDSKDDKLLATESDNKQDSGLDSDCREHEQDGSLPILLHSTHHEENSSQRSVQGTSTFPSQQLHSNENVNFPDVEEPWDELLLLLDVIGQKGLMLRKRIDFLEQTNSSRLSHSFSNFKHQELTSCTQDKVVHHEILSCENSVKTELPKNLDRMECIHRFVKGRESIDNLLDETDQRTSSSPECAEQFVFNKVDNTDNISINQQDGNITSYASHPKVQLDGKSKVDKKSCLRKTEESRLKISSILKERNVIELQRQLLLYVMENDLLKAKLNRTLHRRNAKDKDIQNMEQIFRNDVEYLRKEKMELLIKLRETNLELQTAVTKVRMLEGILQTFLDGNFEENFDKDSLFQEGSEKYRNTISR